VRRAVVRCGATPGHPTHPELAAREHPEEGVRPSDRAGGGAGSGRPYSVGTPGHFEPWPPGGGRLAFPASAATVDMGPAPAEFERHAVLPYEGSYMGHDMYYRTIRFDYRGGKIVNFRVNHTTGFPSPSVTGHQFHHTCHGSLCLRGQWTDDVTVEGIWNNTSGGESHFTAALFAH
jgi:hypothetical protein